CPPPVLPPLGADDPSCGFFTPKRAVPPNRTRQYPHTLTSPRAAPPMKDARARASKGPVPPPIEPNGSDRTAERTPREDVMHPPGPKTIDAVPKPDSGVSARLKRNDANQFLDHRGHQASIAHTKLCNEYAVGQRPLFR